MAVVKFIASKRLQSRAGMAFILSYCSKEKKTMHDGKKLVSGVNCLSSSAYSEFMNTKLLYGKATDRMFYHLFQSFPKEETITPETAHGIALKLAEHFEGYEVLVGTHSDRDHIHSHFIINSVNADAGYKYHPDKDEIQRLRDKSDELCRQYGLSICEPKKSKTQSLSSREYRSAAKGQSWKLQLAIQIDEAMKYAKSKENFIEIMEAEGYKIKWTDTRKNITYTTPEGKKCCDDKLHEEKYLKGSMEDEFRIRQILCGIEKTSDRTIENGIQDRAVSDGFGAELERNNRLASGGDRHDETASREAKHAVDGAKDRGLYEPTTGLSDRVHQHHDRGSSGMPAEESADAGSVSTENEYGINRLYREDENGNSEFILTGWEDERSVFTEYISAERRDEAFFQAAVSGFADTLGLIGSGISLVVEAGSIIRNDHPVEDCTTMKQPNSRKRKKNQDHGGPVMGGM